MVGPAALLGVVLVASTPVRAQGTGASTSTSDAPRSGAGPETRDPKRAPATVKMGEPPKKKDPDEELIDNLERIERLELLQNLELFDTAGPRRK